MRIGLQVAQQLRPWSEVLEFHQVADGLPVFESLWSSDHFQPSAFDADGRPTAIPGSQLEVWTMLAALAQATQRIRLGPLVCCVAYRNPGLLANMVAVVDIVSGGRLELGLGAGWNEGEASRYGIRLGPVGERFDRLAETLEVLDALLTGETVDFDGRHVRMAGASINPTPVQRPHPPFVIGGTGERRTIPLVARWAQHWNLGLVSSEEFEAKLDVLHRCCAEIGRDPDDITISTGVGWGATTDVNRLADRVAAQAALGSDVVIVMTTDQRIKPPDLHRLAGALEAN
jgi:F420-dependent oxidoreductase-like protein